MPLWLSGTWIMDLSCSCHVSLMPKFNRQFSFLHEGGQRTALSDRAMDACSLTLVADKPGPGVTFSRNVRLSWSHGWSFIYFLKRFTRYQVLYRTFILSSVPIRFNLTSCLLYMEIFELTTSHDVKRKVLCYTNWARSVYLKSNQGFSSLNSH